MHWHFPFWVKRPSMSLINEASSKMEMWSASRFLFLINVGRTMVSSRTRHKSLATSCTVVSSSSGPLATSRASTSRAAVFSAFTPLVTFGTKSIFHVPEIFPALSAFKLHYFLVYDTLFMNLAQTINTDTKKKLQFIPLTNFFLKSAHFFLLT